MVSVTHVVATLVANKSYPSAVVAELLGRKCLKSRVSTESIFGIEFSSDALVYANNDSHILELYAGGVFHPLE